MLRRRALLVRSVRSIGALTACLLTGPAAAQQDANVRAAEGQAGAAWDALHAGAIVVFRHAQARS